MRNSKPVNLQAFGHKSKGNPTACVRCRTENSAEGYYETGTCGRGYRPCRVGICRKHKVHGGAKIVWFDNEKEAKL